LIFDPTHGNVQIIRLEGDKKSQNIFINISGSNTGTICIRCRQQIKILLKRQRHLSDLKTSS